MYLRLLAIMLFTAVGLPSFTALASGPSYTYVDARVLAVRRGPEHEFALFDAPRGQIVEGSFGIRDNFHILGNFTRSTQDAQIADLETTTLSVAAGYNRALMDSLDIVGRVGGLRTRTKVDSVFTPPTRDRSSGWLATVGLRARPAERFEVNGFATRYGGDAADTTVSLDLLFHLNRLIAISAGANDDRDLSLGVRFTLR